jgi:amino acid transporter
LPIVLYIANCILSALPQRAKYRSNESSNSLDALLGPKSPHAEFPVVGIYLRATGSRAGTTAMVAVILLLLGMSGTIVVTAASCQLWSFARDGSLPFSAHLAKV